MIWKEIIVRKSCENRAKIVRTKFGNVVLMRFGMKIIVRKSCKIVTEISAGMEDISEAI